MKRVAMPALAVSSLFLPVHQASAAQNERMFRYQGTPAVVLGGTAQRCYIRDSGGWNPAGLSDCTLVCKATPLDGQASVSVATSVSLSSNQHPYWSCAAYSNLHAGQSYDVEAKIICNGEVVDRTGIERVTCR